MTGSERQKERKKREEQERVSEGEFMFSSLFSLPAFPRMPISAINPYSIEWPMTDLMVERLAFASSNESKTKAIVRPSLCAGGKGW